MVKGLWAAGVLLATGTTACAQQAARSDAGIVVLLGDGHGGFEAPTVYPTKESRIVLVDDLDSDGHLDVVALTAAGDRVHVLYGRGDGMFTAARDFTIDGYARDAVIARLGPGEKPQIVAAVGNSLQIITFDERIANSHRVGIPVEATRLATGDFNRDGSEDIASIDDFGTIRLFLGDGLGDIEPQTKTFEAAPFPYRLLSSDFNGDGHGDFVAACGLLGPTGSVPNGTLSLLTSGSNGQFERVDYTAGDEAPASLAVLDANLDGTMDIVVAGLGSERLWLRAGNGRGDVSQLVSTDVGFHPFALTNADLDHDGVQDLIGIDPSQDVAHVLLGRGDGTFEDRPIDSVLRPWSVITADLDGDGALDIIVSSSGALTDVF